MRKLNMLKKLIVLSLVFLIGFYQVPLSVLANTTVETESLEEELEVLEEEIVRVVISDGDTVDLYAEPSTESEIVHLIPHESEVTLVIDEDDYSETEHDFSKVEFVSINESDENEYFLGFIENDYLYTLDEVESVKENKEDEQTDSALIDEDNNSVEEDSTEQVLESDEQNVDSSEEEKEQEEIDTEEDDEEEFTEMSIASIQSNSSAETLNGVALKDRTPVYSEQSTSSTVLRDYSQGTILLYQSLNSTWYQALVILNGVRTTGYIHRDDVETLDLSNQQSLQGLSKLNSTHVYSQPSTSSSTLRSYNAGRLLMYKTFSNEWYEAVVIINGQQQTGYIHKDHVETFDRSNQQSLQGLSSRDKTHVYSQPSTSSSALRSYSPGRLLQYRTLSANWYEAIVIINGQQQTGYIHKDHVETFDRSNQQSLQGLSSRDKTHVYSQPSTSSSALRSYSPGRLLQYKTLSANWYEAIVIINGQQQTGYIHKDHVETFDRSNQQSLQGLSLRDKTHVYSQPSTSSSALRSYSPGRLLQYRTLSANWYEAIVIINGQQQTGYIHKDHVETLDLSNQQSLEGIALKQTHVYSAPSKNSNVLRSYQSGHVLMYKTYSNEWYQALVIIDGQRRTGYIHKNDVETISDTQESLTGYADKSTTNVYSRASRDSSTLRSYSRGQSLQFKTFSSEWYQAIVIINGQQRTGYIHKNDVRFDPITNIHYTNYNYTFSSMIDIQMTRSPQANGTGTIDAGRNLVEYYANPSNFREGENGFYQFLVLSSPAGLNASEVNRSILNSSTGTLAGTAGAFIEAANRFNINEAYLIAHALHETGNGSSALAQGVTVNGRKVYNMYGTAAYDGSAVSSGAQYAYNKGWFTPEAAIIGGAEFVARNYISVGQDTLYKMRWNPGNPGHHQYATHVAWAQIPTNRIANIYNSLDNYLLKFDVPQFQNQPGYSGPNPPPNVIEFTDFPSGSVGITTGTGVRFRSVPSTASNSTIITTIADRNTRLELLGTNNKGWYKAIYNGTEGWISEQYVNALNVLQITATSLNVRSGPSTSNTIVGNLNNGNVVRGVLDSNDNLVTSNGWYQIHFENSQAWISAGSNHQYLSIR